MIINLGISLLVLSVCVGLQYDEDNSDYLDDDSDSESIEKIRTPDMVVKVHSKTKDNKEDTIEESDDLKRPVIAEAPVSITTAKRRSTKPTTRGTSPKRSSAEATSETETEYIEKWPPKYEKLHKNTKVTKYDRQGYTTPAIKTHRRPHEPATEAETFVESNWPPKYEIHNKKTKVTNNDLTKDGNKGVDQVAAELTIDRAGIANYPFSVSIQKKGSHYASGALVHKQWIMSAAKDFYNSQDSIKVFRVRLGSVDCKRGGQLLPMKRIEIHPSFVPGKPDNDVSLLQLAKPVDSTEFIRPISFTKILVKDNLISAKFLATYWPRIIINGRVLPSDAKERKLHNHMRVSTQRLIKWDKCANILTQLKEVLPKSSLCLKPVHSHHSICMPDVGAPVVANDGLWGITSGWVGHNCTDHPSPTVVTRVSTPSVKMWFNDIVYNDDIANQNSFEA